MESSWVRKSILIIATLYTIVLTIGSLIKPVVIKENISHIDKLLHLGAYIGLTVLWMSFYQLYKKGVNAEIKLTRSHYALGFVIVLYGVIIELLQGGITNYRTPDVWDVLANTIGVFIGGLIFVILFKNFKRLKSII